MAPTSARETTPLSSDVAAVAFVQASKLCASLPEDLMADLVTSGEVLVFDPDAIVVTQGDLDDALYIVLDGSVAIRKERGGEILTLATLERQGIFGEIAVLTQRPRSASVVSETDTHLVRFPGKAVRRVAENSAQFGRMLATLMAGRTKDTDRKLRG